MTLYLVDLATILTVHILGLISPGPDFAVTVKQSLSAGRRAGIMTGLGIAVGCSIHMSYCIIGLGFIITQSLLALSILKFAGAGYLIYIGIKALRAKPLTDAEIAVPQKRLSDGAAFRSGLFTNLLNPKATLFFLSLFTIVVRPGTPQLVQASYAVIMTTLTFLWFSFVSTVLSHRRVRQRFQKIQHYVERGMGVVLIALGIKIATER